MQTSDGTLREREVEGAIAHTSLGVIAAVDVSHTDLSPGGFLGEGKGHMDWLVGWAKLFHSPSPFSPFCFLFSPFFSISMLLFYYSSGLVTCRIGLPYDYLSVWKEVDCHTLPYYEQ